jgi:hypothetical protein
MTPKNYLRTLGILFVIGLLLPGCNKDEQEAPPEFQELSFDGEEVMAMLPEGLKNSSDVQAQSCVSFIASAVDMSSFIGQMEVPPDARRSAKKSSSGDDTWQWSWNYMGMSMTMYWSFDEDNSKRSWSMDIQYNDGPVYDYIDAWERKDGTGGEVVYNFNWTYAVSEEEAEYEVLNWNYIWNKNSAGDYTLGWYWKSDSQEYENLVSYDIQIKADGSGSLDYYTEGMRFYEMIWDALGNGTWTMGEDGELSGTWQAG